MLNDHVQELHNKMFSCNECSFEAISSSALKDHVKNLHNTEVETVFSCNKCEYKSILENNLKDHVQSKHIQQQRTNPARNFRRERECELAPCIYWNHGYCSKEDSCKFSHVEIPACDDQDNCRRIRCTLYHFDKSLNGFLGRSHVRTWNNHH